MFVEVHLIQSFVPSNLNRDDLGNPKECEFGGVRRARISSQCFKRAIRTAEVFKATTKVEESIRTRYLSRRIVEGLKSASWDSKDATRVACAVAAAYSSKKKQMDSNDPKRTKVALYLSVADVDWLTERVVQQQEAVSAASTEGEAEPEDQAGEKSKRSKKSKSETSVLDEIVDGLIERTTAHTDAPDIALFGRMLADRPETNVDAACQVAHAISTHAVKAQTDFFTAVDTLLEPDETGAAMMDYANFYSACFYRYARLDWEQLISNLNGKEPTVEEVDLARRTVEGFLRAMAEAVPTGKINAHAQNNPPSFLLAVVRSGGMAWSLANAFERPIRADHEGLVTPSVKALDRYWGRLHSGYGDKTLRRVVVWPWGDDYPLEALEPVRGDSLQIKVTNLDAWVEAVTKELPAGEV